jgi:hypothetical protein
MDDDEVEDGDNGAYEDGEDDAQLYHSNTSVSTRCRTKERIQSFESIFSLDI